MKVFVSPGIFCVAMLVVLLTSCRTTPSKTTGGNVPYTPFDDTREITWSEDFKVVDIKSNSGDHIQKAYFYHAKADRARPLVVSLHTWSGNYTQRDEIAALCKANDLNYIHPDFRGANNTGDACCSALALGDIDEAIDYAMAHANVDPAMIYVIGVSGGGYATLAVFMKSRHPIKTFSAWASISDLVAWFHESKTRKSRYADDILKCTVSENGDLNILHAKARSPLYWQTPVEKVSAASLFIHAGIHDGIQGSVPISHSINFYNKLLKDCGVSDSSKYVTAPEKEMLLQYHKPVGNFSAIGDRKVYLMKQYKNIRLVIFEGGHEMLPVVGLNELLGK